MVETRDRYSTNTNLAVNGPHKQRKDASKWLWKIHDTGKIEHESDEEDSDSSSIDIWLKYWHKRLEKVTPYKA